MSSQKDDLVCLSPRRGLGHNSANVERWTTHSTNFIPRASSLVLADGRSSPFCMERRDDRPSACDSACPSPRRRGITRCPSLLRVIPAVPSKKDCPSPFFTVAPGCCFRISLRLCLHDRRPSESSRSSSTIALQNVLIFVRLTESVAKCTAPLRSARNQEDRQAVLFN